jgi:hypothetical protein
MPTYAKIPKKIDKTQTVAIGSWVIFVKSLSEASAVAIALSRYDSAPLVGHITLKGKKYYYCRYGFLNDPDIYSK